MTTNFDRNSEFISGCKKLKASKTAAIMAMRTEDATRRGIISDEVQTLEGTEKVVPGAWLSVASTGERWLQTDKAIRKTYDEVATSPDGWTAWSPKPNAEVFAYETSVGDEFSIFAAWGTDRGDGLFTQTGKGGDFVLNRPDDSNDWWIVRRELFLATYQTK